MIRGIWTISRFKNSLEQVVQYAAYDEQKIEVLRANMDYLVKAPDRLSVEDDVKKAKKTISANGI